MLVDELHSVIERWADGLAWRIWTACMIDRLIVHPWMYTGVEEAS